MPRRYNIIRKDEIENIVRGCSDNKIRALISLFYITGWRVSEVIQIRKEDFNINDGYVYLTGVALKRRDKREYRHVIKFSVNTPLFEYVNNYLNTLEPIQKLFPLMTRQLALYYIKKEKKNLFCHLFRHTRASRLAEIGGTEFQLQTWFGWKYGNMASEYVRKSPKLIEDLADRID